MIPHLSLVWTRASERSGRRCRRRRVPLENLTHVLSASFKHQLSSESHKASFHCLIRMLSGGLLRNECVSLTLPPLACLPTLLFLDWLTSRKKAAFHVHVFLSASLPSVYSYRRDDFTQDFLWKFNLLSHIRWHLNFLNVLFIQVVYVYTIYTFFGWWNILQDRVKKKNIQTKFWINIVIDAHWYYLRMYICFWQSFRQFSY